MGTNPDALIPMEAFVDILPDDAAIGAAFDLSSTDAIIEAEGGGAMLGLSDSMTDEELARYLASQQG